MRRAIPRKDRFAPVSLSDCGWITGKPEVNSCNQAITRSDTAGWVLSAMAIFHQLTNCFVISR
jgi:hypothetical protein